MGFGVNSNPAIAVAALTGGGFAAIWQNSSSQFAYAIYSNTGTVVTAATNESAIGLSNTSLTVAPRPDGSFIAVVNDTSASQARFKVYSATGVQVIAWTNVAAYNSARARSAVAVRSDNSFVIGVYTSSTNIQYYLYSSTGVAGTNATLISSYNATSSNGHLDMTTLTNDAVIFVYQNSAGQVISRSLSSSNVLSGTEVIVGTTTSVCAVKSLSGGGFVVAYDFTTNRQLRYRFYSAASADLSGQKNNFSAATTTGTNDGSYYPTIVEMASNVVLSTS